MVERTLRLDAIFASLADPTRRDMLSRLAQKEQSVGQLAAHYDISFAAIAKHLTVLERARLVSKRKDGKKQIVSLAPDALKTADEYLEQYRLLWQGRFNKLEKLISERSA
jgi:DNA-binding transcriptional ArsR family regulator